ncbi:hypothetical protein [Psychrobacter sanguinis]|uniref:hypothetical protein n=1 Tax=Psychrobacter sanguinis TaxID=861445 RepID=UPI0028A83652|nr:hypothetical protein [Psychrobacter sanguinis]
MKASSSDKIFSPAALPLPILTAEYSTDLGKTSNTSYKTTSTLSNSYKELRYEHPSAITKNLLETNHTYDTHSTAEKVSLESTLPKSTSKALSHTENNNPGLLFFMKSLLGDKAFDSISLLSASFFISGILLMLYLLN